MSAPMYNSLDKDQKKIFRTGFKNGYKLAKVHNIQDLNKAKSILHFIRRPQKKAVKKNIINQSNRLYCRIGL